MITSSNKLAQGSYVYNGLTPFTFSYDEENDIYNLNVHSQESPKATRRIPYKSFKGFVGGIHANGLKVSDIRKKFMNKLTVIE